MGNFASNAMSAAARNGKTNRIMTPVTRMFPVLQERHRFRALPVG
jgi:hypothetical protein